MVCGDTLVLNIVKKQNQESQDCLAKSRISPSFISLFPPFGEVESHGKKKEGSSAFFQFWEHAPPPPAFPFAFPPINQLSLKGGATVRKKRERRNSATSSPGALVLALRGSSFLFFSKSRKRVAEPREPDRRKKKALPPPLRKGRQGEEKDRKRKQECTPSGGELCVRDGGQCLNNRFKGGHAAWRGTLCSQARQHTQVPKRKVTAHPRSAEQTKAHAHENAPAPFF